MVAKWFSEGDSAIGGDLKYYKFLSTLTILKTASFIHEKQQMENEMILLPWRLHRLMTSDTLSVYITSIITVIIIVTNKR